MLTNLKPDLHEHIRCTNVGCIGRECSCVSFLCKVKTKIQTNTKGLDHVLTQTTNIRSLCNYASKKKKNYYFVTGQLDIQKSTCAHSGLSTHIRQSKAEAHCDPALLISIYDQRIILRNENQL